VIHSFIGYKIELTAEEQAFNYPGQEISPTSSSASILSKTLFPPVLPNLQLKDDATTRALQIQQQAGNFS